MTIEKRLYYAKKGLHYNDEKSLFEVYCIDEVIQEVSAEMVFRTEEEGTFGKFLKSVYEHAAFELTRKLLKK